MSGVQVPPPLPNFLYKTVKKVRSHRVNGEVSLVLDYSYLSESNESEETFTVSRQRLII